MNAEHQLFVIAKTAIKLTRTTPGFTARPNRKLIRIKGGLTGLGGRMGLTPQEVRMIVKRAHAFLDEVDKAEIEREHQLA